MTQGKVSKKAVGTLVGELETLRASLALAGREMSGEDTGKMALAVARLCDSIARVQLAQEKLAALEGSSNRLRREVERILREVGMGEL